MDDEEVIDDQELVVEDEAVEAEDPAVEEETVDNITVEGEEPPVVEDEVPPDAPAWVTKTREVNKELKKRVKELEAMVSKPATEEPAKIVKPKLEDFDFDSDKYDQAMVEYTKSKIKEDQAREAVDAEWKAKVESYEKSKKALRVTGFDEAEATVKDLFTVVQQGIIVNGADLPAELVYVIGRNPARAKELAAIKDPAKFAFAVAKLEGKMKVERKSVPQPERKITTGAGSVASASNLESLRKEAEKTGDYSKYLAAKRK